MALGARMRVLERTVIASFLYGLVALELAARQLASLAAFHHRLLGEIVGLTRDPGEGWLAFAIRKWRAGRQALADENMPDALELYFRRFWSYAGHAGRLPHSRQLSNILRFRGAQWWRGEQRQVDGRRHRDPLARHRRSGTQVRWDQHLPPEWTELCQDRACWQAFCAAWARERVASTVAFVRKREGPAFLDRPLPPGLRRRRRAAAFLVACLEAQVETLPDPVTAGTPGKRVRFAEPAEAPSVVRRDRGAFCSDRQAVVDTFRQ